MSDEFETLPCGAKGVRDSGGCHGIRCTVCLAIWGSIGCPCTMPKRDVPQKTLKVTSPTGHVSYAIWQRRSDAWVCTATSSGIIWMRNNRSTEAVEFMKKNGWSWEWMEQKETSPTSSDSSLIA